MKLLVISLRTTGILKEMFEEYCSKWSQLAELYCITNDNVDIARLNALDCLCLHYRRKELIGYFSYTKIKKAKKYIEYVNPQAIIFFSPHPANIILVPMAAKYKIVCQVHNPIPHSNTIITERIISEIQKRLYCKYCRKIFVAGEKLKEDMQSRYCISEDRIISRPFALISNLQSNEILDAEIYDIIFWGRIEFYKGIDILIDALKLTRVQRRCLIIGKGKPYFDIDKMDNIAFINTYVPDDKLAEYIMKSKIVVLPYRDATGTATVMQAFSFGKPVIATDVGVFPEYVGNAGIIVSPNDSNDLARAIDYLLDTELERKNMGQMAKQYVKTKFDIDDFCEFYIGEMRKVILEEDEEIII